MGFGSGYRKRRRILSCIRHLKKEQERFGLLGLSPENFKILS